MIDNSETGKNYDDIDLRDLYRNLGNGLRTFILFIQNYRFNTHQYEIFFNNLPENLKILSLDLEPSKETIHLSLNLSRLTQLSSLQLRLNSDLSNTTIKKILNTLPNTASTLFLQDKITTNGLLYLNSRFPNNIKSLYIDVEHATISSVNYFITNTTARISNSLGISHYKPKNDDLCLLVSRLNRNIKGLSLTHTQANVSKLASCSSFIPKKISYLAFPGSEFFGGDYKYLGYFFSESLAYFDISRCNIKSDMIEDFSIKFPKKLITNTSSSSFIDFQLNYRETGPIWYMHGNQINNSTHWPARLPANLKFLFLAYNPITNDDAYSIISKLPKSISMINLANCKLNDIRLKKLIELISCRKFNYLDTRGNKFNMSQDG